MPRPTTNSTWRTTPSAPTWNTPSPWSKGRLPGRGGRPKPVQRRILYAMDRMGLGYSGPNNNTPAKPVKSARVVGDVLGRYHPHGDQSPTTRWCAWRRTFRSATR